MKNQRLRCLPVLALFLLLTMLTGCGYLDVVAAQYDKPLIWLNASHANNGSDILIGYRLPAPPPGKVYVVWALTKDFSKVQKMAVLTEGSPTGQVTGHANFKVEGAMISVEDSPNVTKVGENRGITDVGMR